MKLCLEVLKGGRHELVLSDCGHQDRHDFQHHVFVALQKGLKADVYSDNGSEHALYLGEWTEDQILSHAQNVARVILVDLEV